MAGSSSTTTAAGLRLFDGKRAYFTAAAERPEKSGGAVGTRR
jgi:hypothetical protein